MKTQVSDPPMRDQLVVATGAGIASLIADCLIYPFDTMCTWIKLNNSSNKQLNIIKDKLLLGGRNSLFNGFSAQIGSVLIPQSVYFFMYEYSNRKVKRFVDKIDAPELTLLIPTVTATFAEICSLFVLIPFDVMRLRMQSGDPRFQYQSILKGMTEISRKEGVFRLFQGSPIYLAHVLLLNTIIFQAFEYFRVKFHTLSGSHLGGTILASFCATTLAIYSTNPLDTIIRRYQCIGHNLSAGSTILRAAKELGYKGLQKGVFMRLLFSNVQYPLGLVAFQLLREKFGGDFADQIDN